MSDFKIKFSTTLTLELKHLESNTIQLCLTETQAPRLGKTLLAVQQISRYELEMLLQHPDLVA